MQAKLSRRNQTNQADAKRNFPEKLKKRLYPEVLGLLSNNDFYRVTVREISNKSGLSSGTIYKYFSSKEDLIFTILDEEISRINLLITDQIAGMVNIEEILRKVLWVTLDFYDNNPGVAITAFITVPMRTWMKHPSYRRKDDLTTLKRHIAKAQKSGRMDPGLSWGQIIDAYYMVCYRAIHNWYHVQMGYPLTTKMEDCFYMFWKILGPVS